MFFSICCIDAMIQKKVVDCPFVLSYIFSLRVEEQTGMHLSFSQFIKLRKPLSSCSGPKPHDVIGHLLDGPSVRLAFRLIHVHLQGWG